MKLADLPAYAAKNKPLLIGAGAVAAVGAGLYARKTGGPGTAAAARPAAAASTAAPTSLPYSVGGQSYGMSGAGGVYDSSASDLYGALAPQLESITGQLSTMQTNLTSAPPIPVPVPARMPTYNADGSGFASGYYRKAGDSTVYIVGADGATADALSPQELADLGWSGGNLMNNNGRDGIVVVSKDDARWSNIGKQIG